MSSPRSGPAAKGLSALSPSIPGAAVQHLSAAAMGALLLASAGKHFRDPGFYRDVVPGYLCRQDPSPDATPSGTTPDSPTQGSSPQGISTEGSPTQSSPPPSSTGTAAAAQHPWAVLSRDEWIAVSGLLELAAAVGILLPPTRKLTATAITAMFTAFLAGHVDALLRAYGPQGTPRRRKIHAVRLPLQAPLILWAWSLRTRALPGRKHRKPGGRG
ncbi:DoxX family protein [Pseudarthrobacter sp. LMD1-1-1.1]|uniref:DoxX family protein n=1 Tax=Pseudarthrobacter sp. LMD1-1-1.1 TaxID=3135242 RepID=UPI003479E651